MKYRHLNVKALKDDEDLLLIGCVPLDDEWLVDKEGENQVVINILWIDENDLDVDLLGENK